MQSETVTSNELFSDLVLQNVAIKERSQVKIDTQTNVTSYTVTTSNQPILKFVLPTSYYVNLHNIAMKIGNMTISGGTTPSLCNHIASAFARVRVLSGSVVLVDERAYNLHEVMKYQATASASITDSMAKVFGVGTQALRRTWASSGREYIFQPLKNIFPDKLLAIPLLSNYIYIEFYFANPNTCVESATAITNMTFSNVQLIADGIVPSDEYNNQIKNLMAGGKYNFLLQKSDYAISPMVSTSNNIKINIVCKSLKKIYMLQRLGAQIGDISVNDKLQNYNFNGTTEYQFKINNNMYPAQNINVTATALEPFFNMLAAVYDHSQLDDPFEMFRDITNITYDNYVTNKFIIGQQFDHFKQGAEGAILSGIDLSNVSTGVIVILKQTATPDNNLETLCVYDSILMVSPNGDVSVSE